MKGVVLQKTERLAVWMYANVGPHCAVRVEPLLGERVHRQQAFHSCLGVQSLWQKSGVDQMEATTALALEYSAANLKTVQSILKKSTRLAAA